MRSLISGVAAALLIALPAQAKVVDAAANGFQVSQTAEIAAPPEKVWGLLGHPEQWWGSDHTWSGDAKNLSLSLKPDGCYCETFPGGGGAKHMTVIYVQPNKALRLWGALGPLSTLGLVGGWNITLTPKDGGTVVTWTFTVGGYVPGGADKLAPIVDGVMQTQLDRLERLAETGKLD